LLFSVCKINIGEDVIHGGREGGRKEGRKERGNKRRKDGFIKKDLDGG
jgi:hypothetical protein